MVVKRAGCWQTGKGLSAMSTVQRFTTLEMLEILLVVFIKKLF